MRRILALLAALPVLFASAAVRAADADLLERGAYLTHAADCAACHSAPGRAAWTGGRAFTLPFGTLYSPNITPDHETGIGAYTDDEWVAMLHHGIGRGGKHLYPAMPYNSYTLMSRDDALAIKAYLFSLPPVRAEIPANRMRFPFNQRWLMVGWNLLNNPDHRFNPSAERSQDWNRGAYLVDALGHCGQCHTPRTITQGLSNRYLAGATQQGWVAYNLTADKRYGLGGWSDAALVQYLHEGQAPGHGPASGPMAEAVQDSLRYLSDADLRAMVTYLRDVPARTEGTPAVPPPHATPGATPSPGSDETRGARLFADACAGCHLPGGAGRQSAWAALGGDHSTGDPAGTNLVAVLKQGSQMRTSQGLVFMHGFTGAYTATELAALSNYVIAHFSGRTGTVTKQDFAGANR